MSSLFLGAAEETSSLNNSSCYECLMGRFHIRYLAYFTWLNQELVTVPNFPAWVCDICGMTEFDPRAVTILNTLLQPGTGRRGNKPAASREKPNHQTRL